MNIIVLHNNFPTITFQEVATPTFYCLPETAVQKNGKPVFIPEFAEPCFVEVHFAVRICRLGRSISRRFAHRYYDAATVVPHFVAQPLLKAAQSQGLPWSAAMGFDCALPIGEFLPIDPMQIQCNTFRLCIDSEECLCGTTAHMLTTIDEAIAHISQFHTLRNGDLLLSGAPQPAIPINIDHRIETYLNDYRVIAFNVK